MPYPALYTSVNRYSGSYIPIKITYLFSFQLVVPGLPHRMDSAMTWGGNKRTYFFKDDKYWRFDDGWFELEKEYPRSITAIWMKC